MPNIIDVKAIDTGGRNLLFFGKLDNGLYFAYGMDMICLYNDDYQKSFNDNGYLWEKRHKVKQLIDPTEIQEFLEDLMNKIKENKQ